jgi:hypothetical protein
LERKINDVEKLMFYQIGLIEYFTGGVKENSILMIEPNDCHGEVIPGYAKYLLDLGYTVDVVMVWELAWMLPLCRMEDPRIRKVIIPFSYINEFLGNSIVEKYKKIFLTSFRVYRWTKNNMGEPAFGLFPNLKKHRDKLVVVEHHFEKCDESLLRQDRIITLEPFENTLQKNSTACNPHYFGDIAIRPKNMPVINFISVGKIEAARKNHGILINAVLALDKAGIHNFKIIVIGQGKIPVLPVSIRKYFDFRGRVDFPAMYTAMEDADFFLPLLDSGLPAHKRYMDHATTGSFQLIYGFIKPCIIQRPFAHKRGLTEKNSLLYDKNEELCTAMQKAIEMTDIEYEFLQDELQKLVDKIYENSKTTIRRIVEKNEGAFV